MVPPGQVVADVGTDHALLPIYLVHSGRVPRAIASDVSPGSLAKARAAVAAAGLGDRIDLRLGMGLSVLAPGEAPVVVIAGLGALTIAEILSAGRDVAARTELFLLQPMRDPEDLRWHLARTGFRLADEVLVQEGQRFYVLVAAVHGSMEAYSDALMEIGPRLVERPDPLLVPYLKMRIAREKRIWRRAKSEARSAAGRARARLAEERIFAWEEMLNAGYRSQGGERH